MLVSLWPVGCSPCRNECKFPYNAVSSQWGAQRTYTVTVYFITELFGQQMTELLLEVFSPAVGNV